MSYEPMGQAGAQDRTGPGSFQERPRRTGRSLLMGCLAVAVGGIAVVVLIVGAVVIIVLASVVAGAARLAPPGGMAVQEVVVSAEPGAPKVVQVPVRGLLLSGGTGMSADPVQLLSAMLDKARSDRAVRGVMLLVDSGGGGVTACDVMHHAVRQFRADTGLPVVALLEDVAASGGYYVSCAADYIVAHPTTITGSIGVMMPIYDASGLLGKVGVRDRTVKSGEFKDLASPTAERTPERWQQEKEILEATVQSLHQRFVQIVAESRGLKIEEVQDMADGRIFTAQEALKRRLVDDVGYEDVALDRLLARANVPRAQVVQYRRVPSVLEALLSRADLPGRLAGSSLPPQFQHQPMYLWQPALPWPLP